MLKKKAVILLSGGLDSTTCMAIAKKLGYALYAISFSYGQKHSIELRAAKKIGKIFKAKKHLIVDIDLKIIGGSALTGSDISISKNDKIPTTYVPARNTIFLSYALAWAEVLKADNIFIGANQVDYSGYPDCRNEYLKAYECMANLATKRGVAGEKIKIIAPLLNLTKAEIIKKGTALNVDYSLTHSCYFPTKVGFACAKCESCILRKKGFKEAKISDPTIYE